MDKSWRQNYLLRFFLSMILIGFYGCAAGHLSSEQQAQVEGLHIRTLELNNHAKRVILSPNGILEVETTDNEGEYEEGNGERTLFDVRSGNRIWSGPLRKGQMLTDTPSPIVVETADQQHTISRYDLAGNVVWQRAGDGLFVFGLAYEEQDILLSFFLESINGESVHAILHGIALSDGSISWRSDLGTVSLDDYEIGSLWRYQNRPFFGHRDRAFLLLENRTLCISVTDGRVLSDVHIPIELKNSERGGLTWLPYQKDVIVVSGPHVILISEDPDKHWYINLGENTAATGALLADDEVVIAFSGEKERGAAILDAETASWRWQSSVEAKKGAPPRGIVVTGNNVVVASVGRLHGFNRKTGTSLFTEKISKNLLTLFAHENNIVLTGADSIELRSSRDGSLLWKKKDLASPLAWFYMQRKTSMAIISANMQAAASISANQSRWYYSRAGRKIGGSYAYDPFTRSQYTRLGSAAGASAASSEFGASLVGAAGGLAPFIDRKVSIIVGMQSANPLYDQAYFLVPVKTGALTGQTNTAKLAVINLSDGSTYDIPVLEAPMTCIPSVMVNEQLGLIIQAYHKFPFCKASRTIDILRLPVSSPEKRQNVIESGR